MHSSVAAEEVEVEILVGVEDVVVVLDASLAGGYVRVSPVERCSVEVEETVHDVGKHRSA
jgi:hypothetical protein